MLFDVNGLVLLALNQGCDVVIVFRSTFPFIMDCGLIRKQISQILLIFYVASVYLFFI